MLVNHSCKVIKISTVQTKVCISILQLCGYVKEEAE